MNNITYCLSVVNESKDGEAMVFEMDELKSQVAMYGGYFCIRKKIKASSGCDRPEKIWIIPYGCVEIV